MHHKKERQEHDRNEYTDNYTSNLYASKGTKTFELYDPTRNFGCLKDNMKLLFCKISF